MSERDDYAAAARLPGGSGMAGLMGTREHYAKLRHVFTGVWLLYLISPITNLFSGHHSPLWIASGMVIALAFCVTYVWTITHYLTGGRFVKLGLPFIAVLAVVANLIYGTDWIPMWIYVSAATGYMVTGRARAVRAVLAVTACFALMSLVTHTTVDTFIGLVLPVLLIGVAMSGFRVQIQLMRELSLAKETVAKLAASEERLRLARDMHDLTGQSLSMITLKSELVRKLLARLPETRERDAAINEASDISRVSRQTLHDIREAVSGYRRPTLAVEIITARTALEAAGIDLDDDPALTVQSGTFDSDAEAALAWCLREAVTNVIRHSGAKTCQVRLTQHPGELSLEVSDDGHGLQALSDHPPAAQPSADQPSAEQPSAGQPQAEQPLAGQISAGEPSADQPSAQRPSAQRPSGDHLSVGQPSTDQMPAPVASVSGGSPAGSGLRGMSERLTAIGGRLSFGHATTGRGGNRGLRLVATVPDLPVPQAGLPPVTAQPAPEVTRAPLAPLTPESPPARHPADR
jgi:two-component system, NarL family, sensor histidine kinase DesK